MSDLDWSRIETGIDAAIPEALAEGMEHIRATSAPLVPVETGRLVGGASVEVDGDQASLSYPGPYARIQHERLDFHHEHGQAKYLEQPMRTEADTALQIVARRIQGAL